MRTELPSVLRVHGEPGEYYDDSQIHALLTERPGDYVAFVLEGLAAIASNSVALELPAKQIFSDPGHDADFRIMPCNLRSQRGMRKTVKLVGTNTAQRVVPGQITVGRTFALHPLENFITHTFDACLLSSARTGVCAAIAVQLLTTHCKRVAIIGVGRVAYYSARYLLALGLTETLYFHDIDPRRAESMVEELGANAGTGTCTIISGRPTEAVDAVVIATTSDTPVYALEDFPAGTVVSLGADTAWQRELDPGLAGDSAIYVDTLDSIRYGDLHAWIAAGLTTADHLIDLLSLLRRGVAHAEDQRRLFISTGSALFDNLTVGYLLSLTSGDTLQGAGASSSEMKFSYLPLSARMAPS